MEKIVTLVSSKNSKGKSFNELLLSGLISILPSSEDGRRKLLEMVNDWAISAITLQMQKPRKRGAGLVKEGMIAAQNFRVSPILLPTVCVCLNTLSH